MEESNANPLFADNSQALVASRDAAAVARAVQEIQAALVIGQRFPRDEIRVKARIIEACKRKGLAEVSEYEYSRGGTRITGPTIDLLRAIANRWGNILYGWSEVERRDGESTVRCEAWDTQTNGHAYRTFVVKHWRDTTAGGYELTDERDIYEALANVAARRVRACLEEVIDADVVADAIDQCRRTMREGEKTPLKDRAVQMVAAFAEFGVTQAQIETRLGNKLDAVSENQLASLRRVFKSLKDGVGQREEFFKPETAAPKFDTAPEKPLPAEDNPELAPVTPPPPKQTSKPAAPAASEPENKLKLIRASCKSGGIKEGKLLEFLNTIGLTDGGIGSLEELAIVRGGSEIVDKIIRQWPDIRDRLTSPKTPAEAEVE